MPGHVVDLDRPPDARQGAVRVDHDTGRQADRVLADQLGEPGSSERLEHSEFELRSGRSLPVAPL
ncbi:MAG: hypothetical protein ACO218_11140 [Steroidobacteraceae bacterium]